MKGPSGADIAHIIPCVLRKNPLRVVAVLMMVLCMSAVSAQASPASVLADFRVDQRLDRSYPVSDLRGALDQAQGTPRYQELLAAVDNQISNTLLGVHPSTSGAPAVPAPRPPDQRGSQGAKVISGPGSIVPIPSTGPPASGLPLVIVTLGALALLLGLGGMASAISRRQTRV